MGAFRGTFLSLTSTNHVSGDLLLSKEVVIFSTALTSIKRAMGIKVACFLRNSGKGQKGW